MISPDKARAIFAACDVPAISDFHALTSTQVNNLLAYATEGTIPMFNGLARIAAETQGR